MGNTKAKSAGTVAGDAIATQAGYTGTTIGDAKATHRQTSIGDAGTKIKFSRVKTTIMRKSNTVDYGR